MAAQTPEVSSGLIDFLSGPILLQSSRFPPFRARVSETERGLGWERCPLRRLQMRGQLKADPHILERGSPDFPE